jgi:hypothetical protein
VDTDGYGSTVRLVPLDTVNVDDPLLAVDLGDLALATDILSTGDSDLVVSADGERASLQGVSWGKWERKGQTLCFARRSLERGEDMITRRTEEGAAK